MLQAGLMASLIRWNWMHQNYLHYEISFTLCWQNIILKDSFPTQKSGSALLSARTSRTPPPSTRFTTSLNEWETQTTSKKRFWKCLQKESQTTSKCRAAKVPHPREEHSMIWIFMQRWPAFMWCITYIRQFGTKHLKWFDINHLGSLCPFETL